MVQIHPYTMHLISRLLTIYYFSRSCLGGSYTPQGGPPSYPRTQESMIVNSVGSPASVAPSPLQGPHSQPASVIYFETPILFVALNDGNLGATCGCHYANSFTQSSHIRPITIFGQRQVAYPT